MVNGQLNDFVHLTATLKIGLFDCVTDATDGAIASANTILIWYEFPLVATSFEFSEIIKELSD